MSETEAPAAEIPRPSVSLWPLYAAAALVVAALVSVWALLHPRPRGGVLDAEAVPATVTVESVALSAQGAPGSAALETLKAGGRVKVFPKDGTWIEAETEGGKRGFLPADAIETDADRDARKQRARTLLGLPPVFGVVGEDCDLRLAPYPHAPLGGTLRKGAIIEIHSVDHSFFAIRNDAWGVAFVASRHVDIVPPDPKLPPIHPEKMRPLKDLSVVELENEPPPEPEIPGGEISEAPAAPATGSGMPGGPAAAAIEPPVLVTRVEPAYPEMARRAGIEGTVELEILIDAQGRVAEVEVVRGLPLGLSQAAADAVQRWVYRPARSAAGPVPSRKTIRVLFQLQTERR